MLDILNRDEYWSIPERGPDSDGGRLEKFIAEKSNGSDGLNDVDVLLSPAGQVYKLSEDDSFKNSVIGESGIGTTLLCDMVELLKVDDGCGIVNGEGVVWRCGFVMAVEYCEHMNADVFTVVSWHCKLGGGTVMGCICALATTVVICGLVTAVEIISPV